MKCSALTIAKFLPLAFCIAFYPCLLQAANLVALRALQRRGALVSAEVRDLDSGSVIARLDPAKRLTPASLTKLVTAAAALEHWDTDHRFTTTLLINRPIVNGIVTGDLILKGAGDPSLDDSALWSLASQVKSAGVRAIDGSLLVVQAPFGPTKCETQDRCDALERSDTAYNAPISSIGVDFGTWCVRIRPLQPGQPAQVGACAAAHLPIPIDGEISTVASYRSPSYWVERFTQNGREALHIGGEIPQGAPLEIYRAMSDPARDTGLLLAEMLKEIGIQINGRVRVAAGAATRTTSLLASVQGWSLREQLDGMLRYSNNYIADTLTFDLAAEASPVQLTQLSQASKVLSLFLLHADGNQSQSDPPTLLSGSGLTPENRLSAQELCGLLNHMYHDAVNFPAFYGGLVVPKEAPFVFLRGGTSRWLDRVALKTGTMDYPRSVFGIAGYLRKKNGGFMDFAIIVNGSARRKHIPLYQSLAASRQAIESILAHH